MSVEAKSSQYVCIECLHKVESIFKVYQDGFKDIIQCPRCNELVDSYIECEKSVVLIDLVLFKKRAYAHILQNEFIKNAQLFKVLVTFLLCDAYLHWFHDKNRQYESMRSNDQQLFYELEWNFYFMLIRAIINFLVYTTTLLVCCYLNHKLLESNSKEFSFSLVLKSLVLSSFGKMVVIPLVIWNPIEIYFNLAQIFTYFSNFQALIVAASISQTKAFGVVFFSACLTYLFSSDIDLSILNTV